MRTNPFSPSFGTAPPVLAGRDHILEEVDAALDAGPSHPGYTLLGGGQRAGPLSRRPAPIGLSTHPWERGG